MQGGVKTNHKLAGNPSQAAQKRCGELKDTDVRIN